MSLLLAFLLLVGGALLLVKGADWFMDGVGEVARKTSISLVVLGAILAGLEPEEMLTAAIASAQGKPALALGNIIGTNITMLTAALGLAALLAPIVFARTIRRQAIIATVVSLIPLGLLFVGTLSRLMGALLLLIFIVYTIFLLRTDRAALASMEALEALEEDDDDDEQDEKHPLWRSVVVTLIGLLAMALGGPAIVQGATGLTETLGLSEHVIGATLVSLATAAEMIVLGVVAARKRKTEVLVGGILGSFAYNLLVTLGVAALIRPLPVDLTQLKVTLPAMLLFHVLLLIMIWRGRMGRVAGVGLLLSYGIYIGVLVVSGVKL